MVLSAAVLCVCLCCLAADYHLRFTELQQGRNIRHLICYRAETITEPPWKDIGPGPKHPSSSVWCAFLNGLQDGTIGKLLSRQTAMASLCVPLIKVSGGNGLLAVMLWRENMGDLIGFGFWINSAWPPLNIERMIYGVTVGLSQVFTSHCENNYQGISPAKCSQTDPGELTDVLGFCVFDKMRVHAGPQDSQHLLIG